MTERSTGRLLVTATLVCAVIALVVIGLVQRSDGRERAGCVAWRQSTHGAIPPADAHEIASQSDDASFVDASRGMLDLANGVSTDVSGFYETCEELGEPIIDSAHTGES
jgi:hypothetical protein